MNYRNTLDGRPGKRTTGPLPGNITQITGYGIQHSRPAEKLIFENEPGET